MLAVYNEGEDRYHYDLKEHGRTHHSAHLHCACNSSVRVSLSFSTIINKNLNFRLV